MNQTICFKENSNNISVRPDVSPDEIKKLLLTCFGLQVDANCKCIELTSYDDRNYMIECKFIERSDMLDVKCKHNKFVLKIFNANNTGKHIWCENINRYLNYCYEKCDTFKIPLPLARVDSKTMAALYEIPLQRNVKVIGCSLSIDEIVSKYELVTQRDGVYYVRHMVRLSVYVPGVLVDIEDITDLQAYNFGKAVATLDLALKEIVAPDVDEQEHWIWNLVNIIKNDIYNPYVNTLEDVDHKKMVEDILEEFSTETLPKIETLGQQWIHGDTNEHNILFHEFENCSDIAGIIDFDDMVYSYGVVDLGSSLMYITAGRKDQVCLGLAKNLYQGYSSVVSLSDIEFGCLYNLMLVRYVMECCLGLYQYKYVDPDNDYLLTTNCWGRLQYLYELGKDEFLRKLKE